MSFFVIVCLFAIPMSSADVLLLSFFFFFLLHSTLTVFLTPTSVFHKNSVFFFFLFTPRVYVYFVWLLTVIRSPLFLFISFSVEEQWMIKADFFCLLFSCCIIYCVRFSFSFFSRFECFFFKSPYVGLLTFFLRFFFFFFFFFPEYFCCCFVSVVDEVFRVVLLFIFLLLFLTFL